MAKAGALRGMPAFRAIAAQIERQIMAGELSVGAAMQAEQALAARFGVARSTIREAIRLLEQMGLLARAAGRNKLVITAPHARNIGDRMRARFLLQETTFHQLWEVLAAIEPMCAESASLHAGQEDLEALEENLRQTREAHAAGRDLVELDIAFHALVARATRNGALQMSRETIGELFYPAFLQVMHRLNAGDRLLVAHTKILQAIRGRNSSEARGWMERHIGDFKRGCELANLDFNGAISSPMEQADE